MECQTSLQGRLRINLPTAFAMGYLEAPMAEFKAHDPALSIDGVRIFVDFLVAHFRQPAWAEFM